MFLPTTPEEIRKLGWNQPDIILVTGDTYIDSPYIGAAQIGKYLSANGFRVAIIAQPVTDSGADITRLGEPSLFWGISGGSVDSMVANYTASHKKRRQDDFTPGEVNDRRPDRAVIAYANLIRRFFKNTRPLVLGGIEASLRRVAHYDFWSNSVRRSILFDAKADYLVYGMGEKTVLNLARRLKDSQDVRGVEGLAFISGVSDFKEMAIDQKYLELPSFEQCSKNTTEGKNKFIEMFNTFYSNNDPITARGLYQKTGDRYLIQNPPQSTPDQNELDSYYNLSFERDVHPYYAKAGKVRALDTIRFSVTTHRGCYGECNFCAITVHQGRTVLSRSEKSILKEVAELTYHPKFRGVVSDVGGPTANMYGYECSKKIRAGCCDDKRCVFPNTCDTLGPDHSSQINLLKKLESVPKVKHIFVASGIRYDLVTEDEKYGRKYLEKIVRNHTSGQMKIAPEHISAHVLKLMGKPSHESLKKFADLFYDLSEKSGKKQFLTYYFIAAHPGCRSEDMVNLKNYASRDLGIHPEQIQIYTPAPSTWSSVMYYTGMNPFEKKNGSWDSVYVERNLTGKIRQKDILVSKVGRKSY